MKNWSFPPKNASGIASGAKAAEGRRHALASARTRLEEVQAGFISTAAQTLRNPLMLLQGYSTMLNEMAQRGQVDIQQVSAIVERIATGTHQLRNAIEETLELTMIEARALELVLAPVALPTVLSEILHELRQAVTRRGCSVSMDRMQRLPKVWADVDRLHQALRIILGYAVEHSVTGCIRVTARVVEGPDALAGPVRKAGPPFVEVIVADSCEGMEELQGRLLSRPTASPSPDEDRVRRKRAELQLSIAKGVVELHSGKLWTEATEGDELSPAGIEFHILLPTEAVEDDATRSAATP